MLYLQLILQFIFLTQLYDYFNEIICSELVNNMGSKLFSAQVMQVMQVT